MKHLASIAVGLALCGTCVAADYVRGHTRQDGTYVAPHYRSSPDNSRLNNYSTQGNVNPYTGQAGTVNPYPTPSYNTMQPMQLQPIRPLQPHVPVF